jgi:2,4-dienoyl-CoA reductase-like NADH-dependent reductase (Old Yellow Enzyme family)
MAPLTRMRAQRHEHVPTTLQAEYYAQRASAGLIITEATAISPEGFGWADTPGLWTEEQVRGWRRVTDAVHAAGGRIIAQLWHTGAISHPELLDGAQPVSASNVDPGQRRNPARHRIRNSEAEYPLIANVKMDRDRGNRLIAEGLADLVAFGRPYIANPDLVQRFAENVPLAEVDWETVYASGPHGYSDYPTYQSS